MQEIWYKYANKYASNMQVICRIILWCKKYDKYASKYDKYATCIYYGKYARKYAKKYAKYVKFADHVENMQNMHSPPCWSGLRWARVATIWPSESLSQGRDYRAFAEAGSQLSGLRWARVVTIGVCWARVATMGPCWARVATIGPSLSQGRARVVISETPAE